MYLKEIYLENFKSFGKKLKIPFLPGFTGITGPNGSGKSNISDAILFVLGPKSSKVIRAGRLTDLIFNGGSTKKPADYCKVSLVFDNSDRTIPIDNEEVTLTRFVKYADGAQAQDYYSYFYINGKCSSLSEFENLLAYAQISGDGYNIVQQGDVNAIISMGGVERRKIFDSIAGVAKFDSDIRSSEEKKAGLNANLERIQIILEETKARLSELEDERAKALSYKELRDQLMLRKYQLCGKRKKSAEHELEKVNQQLKTFLDEKRAAELKLENLKKALSAKRKNLEATERKLAARGGEGAKELNEKIAAYRAELVKADEGINYCRDELRKLKDRRARTVIELNSIERKLGKVLMERKKLERELEERKKTLKNDEDEYKKVQELISKSDTSSRAIQRELVKLKKEYELVQEELKKQKIELDIGAEKARLVTHELSELEENVATYQSELKANEDQIKGLRHELKGGEEHESSIKQKLSALTEKDSELQLKLKGIETIIRKLTTQYSQLKAEFSAVEALHKGYTRAVQAILEARDRGELKGIHGAVAELGTPPKEYELALTVAAGGRLQSIVVDNDTQATKAINWLKHKKLGRATFLPLNKLMKGYPAGKALLTVKDPDAIGFAIDTIKFKEEYRRAFWYVFGSTIIMKSLESARKWLGGVRLVTLEGELLEASGAMIGGSIEPRVKFGSSDTELDRVGSQLRKELQVQEKLYSELSTTRAELDKLGNELKRIANSREGASNKLSSLELEKKGYLVKLNNLKELKAEKASKLEALRKFLSTCEERIKSSTEKLAELERAKAEKGKLLLESAAETLAVKSSQLQTAIAERSEEIRNLESKLQTLKTESELINQRKQELQEQEASVVKDDEEKSAKIQFLTEAKHKYRNELDALIKVEESASQELKSLNELREKISNQVVELEKDIETAAGRLTTYEDLHSKEARRIPALEERLGELILELQSYAAQVELKKEEKVPSMEELKKVIQDCENGMRALEPVNMRAIEDYDQQAKRRGELDKESRHLVEQKEELIKVVLELEKKKKASLLRVFSSVNENFKNIYAQLSNGNEGELALENPESPFEAGLTIKVKKGKKKLRVEALSGGEKSLTALAFIFAIQEFQPSPFYVLDEVDIHLDAVNADVVAQLIKKSAEVAQFITISLRKVTLKEADHLYGLIKGKDDCSTLIGQVNLAEVGEDGRVAANGGEK